MKKFEIKGNQWISFEIKTSSTTTQLMYNLRKAKKFSSSVNRYSNVFHSAEINFLISKGAYNAIKYDSKEEELFLADLKVLEGIIFGKA